MRRVYKASDSLVPLHRDCATNLSAACNSSWSRKKGSTMNALLSPFQCVPCGGSLSRMTYWLLLLKESCCCCWTYLRSKSNSSSTAFTSLNFLFLCCCVRLLSTHSIWGLFLGKEIVYFTMELRKVGKRPVFSSFGY